ncbi:MAG: phage tail tape measure protein [Roseitalea sp.]|nr:phage tail tape measure protein [Roseitalea sp.]MBO6950973.1 phage tail tape measure protein [Rhizobiaceae bacterium]MBO6591040.1 phage tail tape measure protein [Roseitalea sp.]MBO6599702.1 phage tail tape measure protein [Roseitalea sp.]MBO6611458.1 phage tail tape measure protein [Roseitalea sp.]
MSNLAVALAITLQDGLTGAPAERLKTTIKGIGDSINNARKGFAEGFSSAFTVGNIDQALQDNERRLGEAKRGLVGALAMGATIAIPVKLAGDFQDEFIEFAKVAELPVEQWGAVEAQLVEAMRLTGKSKSEMLAIVATYVGKGMDVSQAIDAMVATGRTATATKASVGDMSNSGFAVMDNLNVAAADLQTAFNVMAVTGKEGSFELQAMARKFPEITAGAKSLKMEGVPAVASLSAALQIAMKSAGSEDQAATNLSNFLGKITAPDTVRKFAEMGVNIEAEMRKAEEAGIDVLDHMLSVIADKTGGDAFKMGELFQDKQVLDFLKAIIPNLEEFRRIRDKALNADDVISQDFELEAMKLNFAVAGLRNAITAMMGSGGVLLPMLTDLANSTTGIVYAVTDWTAANPEMTATIIKGTAALLAFNIAMRAGAVATYGMRGAMIKTIATFFKFDEAGKNAAVGAKALRGLGVAGRVGFAALTGLATGASSAIVGAFAGIGAAIAGVTAPVWLAGAAIAAVVIGTGALIYKYWEPISGFVGGMASVIGSATGEMLSTIAGFGGEVLATVAEWGSQTIVDIADWLGLDPQRVAQALGDAKIAVAAGFDAMVDIAKALPGRIGEWFMSIFSQNDYGAAAEASFRTAGERAGQAMVDAIKAAFDGLVVWFFGVPGKIVEAIGNIDLSGIISWPSLPGWLGGGGDQAPPSDTPTTRRDRRQEQTATNDPTDAPDAAAPPRNDPPTTRRDRRRQRAAANDPTVEPAYAPPAASAVPPPPPVINQTYAPQVNVSAPTTVNNEANINRVAAAVGARTEKSVRQALSDAGAE